MAPTIYIVRHAEGYHNSSYLGENIRDPFLTDKGKGQCEELCKNFPHHDKIEVLMASPMKRTIQTCKYSFQPVVDRLGKIVLAPLAQEASDESMDTGSCTEELVDTFGDLIDTHRVDEVHPYWYRNVGIFSPNPQAQIERARRLRCFLKSRPEKHIVLVSHGSFAHAITGNFTDSGEQTTRMWSNAECRIYTFDEASGDESKLVETQESIDNRPDLAKKDAETSA